MATHDYVIANGTGAAVRSDLNNALAAIVSNNSGSSEPGTTYAYQWWADTNANVLKLRNSANDGWITLRELDGTMLIEDGSASTPGLAFADDVNTGIFSPAADQIGFATGGAERLEIGSSEVVFNDPSNDVDFRVESNGQTHMLFVDAGNDRIGIGTSAPATEVAIIGTDGSITFGNSHSDEHKLSWDEGSIILEADPANLNGSSSIQFKVDASEQARIDSSGRLLVGTSSSSASTAAVFQGNSFGSGQANQVYFQRDTAGTGLSAGDGIGFLLFADNAGNVFSQIGCQADATTGSSDYPGRLAFYTTADGASSPTERMRVNQDGSIFFGRTNSTIDNSNHGMVFFDSFRLDLGRDVSATGSVFQAFGNAGQFRIMGDGDAENTNNRYTGISDIKYKQNVQNASSQWDDIKAIQVRKYELIANPGVKHIGVVAQELEQICPGLVIERTVDEETGETAKSVAYSVLYMKAVKALQEAMERIETLEAKVAALEAG